MVHQVALNFLYTLPCFLVFIILWHSLRKIPTKCKVAENVCRIMSQTFSIEKPCSALFSFSTYDQMNGIHSRVACLHLSREIQKLSYICNFIFFVSTRVTSRPNFDYDFIKVFSNLFHRNNFSKLNKLFMAPWGKYAQQEVINMLKQIIWRHKAVLHKSAQPLIKFQTDSAHMGSHQFSKASFYFLYDLAATFQEVHNQRSQTGFLITEITKRCPRPHQE